MELPFEHFGMWVGEEPSLFILAESSIWLFQLLWLNILSLIWGEYLHSVTETKCGVICQQFQIIFPLQYLNVNRFP